MAHFKFNLWRDPWITVVLPSGSTERVSASQLMGQAHQYVQIIDRSPLAETGIFRAMVAISHQITQCKTLDDIGAALSAGQFSASEIKRFADRHASGLDMDALLDENLVAAKPSIGRLFPHLASGSRQCLTGHQVLDREKWVCPACFASGMFTLTAFGFGDGRGTDGSYLKASINGNAPLYVTPRGRTLYESLILSLVLPENQPPVRNSVDHPLWSPLPTETETEWGYLQSLTRSTRRFNVEFERRPDQPCVVCGQASEWLANRCGMGRGMFRDTDAPTWIDPFMAYNVSADREYKAARLYPGQSWLWIWGMFFTNCDPNDKRGWVRPALVSQFDATQKFLGGFVPRWRLTGLVTDPARTAKLVEWHAREFSPMPVSVMESLGKAWRIARRYAPHSSATQSDVAVYWSAAQSAFTNLMLGTAELPEFIDCVARDPSQAARILTRVQMGEFDA
jgi:hypothetical protein